MIRFAGLNSNRAHDTINGWLMTSRGRGLDHHTRAPVRRTGAAGRRANVSSPDDGSGYGAAFRTEYPPVRGPGSPRTGASWSAVSLRVAGWLHPVAAPVREPPDEHAWLGLL